MGYERLAYDDQDTTVQMHDDCLVCASHMRLPHDALTPATVDLDEVDEATHRHGIEVSAATADLASRLYLD